MAADALCARELRWRMRTELVRIHGRAVVSVTLRMPAALRSREEYRELHRGLCAQLEAYALREGAGFERVLDSLDADGPCTCFTAPSAGRAKELCVRFEEEAPGGVLLDADVMDEGGRPLSRGQDAQKSRPCLVCARAPAILCVRSQAHSAKETEEAVARLAEGLFPPPGAAARNIARLALRAVLYEAAVTPKPGLVDRLGPGAHRDMDFYTFLSGASALFPCFEACARAGEAAGEAAEKLLPRLRPLGLQAEAEMLRATGGRNTHRGTIFSLGLLCAAAGSLLARGLAPAAEAVCALAGRIAAPSLGDLGLPEAALSHGQKVFLSQGAQGARGEAARGFPSVLAYALPRLRQLLEEGKNPDEAGGAALLNLMARVEDSNVLYRAGPEGLARMRSRAGALLAGGADPGALRRFSDSMDREGLSPGGCADLLAAAFFLYFLQKEA